MYVLVGLIFKHADWVGAAPQPILLEKESSSHVLWNATAMQPGLEVLF